MSPSPAPGARTLPARLLFLLAALCAGCQALPFGPRYTYPAFAPSDARPAIPVMLIDERPAWQREYWQGAESPRDHELAITFIPLEKFRPHVEGDDGPGWSDTLALDKSSRTANERELTLAVSQAVEDLGLSPVRAELCLESFAVVVNKCDVARRIWVESEESRREALAKWRRGGQTRAMLGVSSGLGPGYRGDSIGAGVMLGPPADMPPLPGERPLGRVYGTVRGPPPDLGEYGPDVTCEIRARVAVWLDRDQPCTIQLHSVARSLPLEPPHYDAQPAIPTTFRQALLEFESEVREQLAALERGESPARFDPSAQFEHGELPGN